MNDFKELDDDTIILKLVLQSNGYMCAPGWYYKVYLKDTNDDIGECEFHRNSKDKYLGNIGYYIDDKYRNKGYAKKIVNLLSNMALELGMDNIKITTDANNIASIKVIEAFNGTLIEVSKVPLNVRLYKDSKIVNIYQVKIEKEGRIL